VRRDLQWERDEIANVIAPFVGGNHPSTEDAQRLAKLASLIPDDKADSPLGKYLSNYETIAMDNIEGTRLRKVKLEHMQALVNLGYVQASIAIAKYFVIGEIESIVNRDKCGCDSKDFERSTFWQEHSDQFRDFMANIPPQVFISKMALPCANANATNPSSKSNLLGIKPQDACRGGT
jgi:hypothetical protein